MAKTRTQILINSSKIDTRLKMIEKGELRGKQSMVNMKQGLNLASTLRIEHSNGRKRGVPSKLSLKGRVCTRLIDKTMRKNFMARTKSSTHHLRVPKSDLIAKRMSQ